MAAIATTAQRWSLLLLGDVMLGRLVNQRLQQVSPAYPWGDTLPLLQQADVRICNLECVLADAGTPWSLTPKVFHFRSDARNIAVLQAAQIDAVSLANNHTLDFGYEALLHMLTLLETAGIRYAGAGRTLDEAARAALWQVRGIRLAFLAATDNEPAWEAGPEQPGVWYIPIEPHDRRVERLLAAIRALRAQSDLVIVSLHWGSNWGYTPPPEHVAFAHTLIDAGADIIFGHSCHVVRGVEVYKSRLILYGCGDFIDDYAVDPLERNDRSFLFLVELQGARLTRLRLYPTVIREMQARRAQGEERAALVTTMRHLCERLQTALRWQEQEACLEIAIV
jgi:poly-gamma-glutamate capsule biosynthesis protein CapA/YwtB (metallophosphatase superfamily)